MHLAGGLDQDDGSSYCIEHEHLMTSITQLLDSEEFSFNQAAQDYIRTLMLKCERQIPDVDMRKLFSANLVTTEDEKNTGYLKPEQ